MSELRSDPITDRWVIVAGNRLARPTEYEVPTPPTPPENCPFCEGHEERTPPEVEAVRESGSEANRPGWTVRTIPNKFPTVSGEVSDSPSRRDAGPFEARSLPGAHEVIIQSPRHAPTLPFLSPAHRRSIFRMFRNRVRAWSERTEIESVLLFENSGPESGGTLYHPHAQLIALPLVPPTIVDEISGAERWARTHDGGCVWESIADAERAARSRLVWEDDSLLAIAPWASEYPYEMLVLPRHHEASFTFASEADLDRLADVIPGLLRAILKVRPSASYNYILHTAPLHGGSVPFHWHIHITPRVVRPDGFEIGGGIPVNPLAPEAAAEQIRSAGG